MNRSTFLIVGVTIFLSLGILFWLKPTSNSYQDEDRSQIFSVSKESRCLVIRLNNRDLIIKRGFVRLSDGSVLQPEEVADGKWKFRTELRAGVFVGVECTPTECRLVWHRFDLDEEKDSQEFMSFLWLMVSLVAFCGLLAYSVISLLRQFPKPAGS